MTASPRPPSKPRRRPKLAHVAMAAGVSIGTASDALRGRGRMSDETRDRVVKAAESLGYRANANARILASARSQIVALVMQRAGDEQSRIYWPRVQAAFSETLFAQGLVACTMSVTDLHQLDGLPFDLIVYAVPQNAQPLPEEIRSAYHVMELDLAGSQPSAEAMQAQVATMCVGVLEQLVRMGSTHPALVISSDPIVPVEWIEVPYQEWCKTRGMSPFVDRRMDSEPDGSAKDAFEGADGIFHTFVTADRVDQSPWPVLPTVQLVAHARTDPGPMVHQLTIDGTAIGTRLAHNAIAYLNDRPLKPLELAWELDGEPWDPQSGRQFAGSEVARVPKPFPAGSDSLPEWKSNASARTNGCPEQAAT